MSRLALVVAAVAALALLWLRLRSRSVRSGDSLRDFLRHFDAGDVPADLALAVFHRLQAWRADSGGGRVAADDPLSSYGLAPEDVPAAAARLAAECGRRLGPFDAASLRRVEDLVLLLARSPEAA